MSEPEARGPKEHENMDRWIDHGLAHFSAPNIHPGEKEPMSMSDLDPISELQARLTQLESNLTYVRTGKSPPQPVDLLAWRANGSALAGQAANANDAGAWNRIRRTLRDDWRGMTEAIRNWAIRVEERFGR